VSPTNPEQNLCAPRRTFDDTRCAWSYLTFFNRAATLGKLLFAILRTGVKRFGFPLNGEGTNVKYSRTISGENFKL
jgi:hypothetical protein